MGGNEKKEGDKASDKNKENQTNKKTFVGDNHPLSDPLSAPRAGGDETPLSKKQPAKLEVPGGGQPSQVPTDRPPPGQTTQGDTPSMPKDVATKPTQVADAPPTFAKPTVDQKLETFKQVFTQKDAHSTINNPEYQAPTGSAKKALLPDSSGFPKIATGKEQQPPQKPIEYAGNTGAPLQESRGIPQNREFQQQRQHFQQDPRPPIESPPWVRPTTNVDIPPQAPAATIKELRTQQVLPTITKETPRPPERIDSEQRVQKPLIDRISILEIPPIQEAKSQTKTPEAEKREYGPRQPEPIPKGFTAVAGKPESFVILSAVKKDNLKETNTVAEASEKTKVSTYTIRGDGIQKIADFKENKELGIRKDEPIGKIAETKPDNAQVKPTKPPVDRGGSELIVEGKQVKPSRPAPDTKPSKESETKKPEKTEQTIKHTEKAPDKPVRGSENEPKLQPKAPETKTAVGGSLGASEPTRVTPVRHGERTEKIQPIAKGTQPSIKGTETKPTQISSEVSLKDQPRRPLIKLPEITKFGEKKPAEKKAEKADRKTKEAEDKKPEASKKAEIEAPKDVQSKGKAVPHISTSGTYTLISPSMRLDPTPIKDGFIQKIQDVARKLLIQPDSQKGRELAHVEDLKQRRDKAKKIRRSYMIQKSDTLETIAEVIYGDRNLAKLLRMLNKQAALMQLDASLDDLAGSKLVLPSQEDLEIFKTY